MAQVVHHHDSGDSGWGFFMAVVVLILFVLALWYWGLPRFRGAEESGIQIEVPSQIDVNINQEGSGGGGTY